MMRGEPTLRECLGRVLALAAFLWSSGTPLPAQQADTVAHRAAHAMEWGREQFVLSEVLEYFDLVAWIGGAERRLWLKADGSAATIGREQHVEYQALYGRLVSPWWDAQLGLRADVRNGPAGDASRVGAVIGLQGLAPQWFELEPSVFVTTGGNVSFDFTGSYDLFVTQRLVVQPRLESTVALREEAEFGIGSGLSSAAFGVRARYELRREIAPYLGVVWERGFGRSAELARLAGDAVSGTYLVAGLRLWR
jgi:copper resistance protein B